MSGEINIILASAASIGFIHTLLGPDHYLPFIMMAKARKWSMMRTAVITSLCGLGHVAGSIALGFIGIGLGLAVGKLELIESYRGEIAAWAFIGFGLAYFIWALRRAYRNKPHTHFHDHADGDNHEHTHNHHKEHAHVHQKKNTVSITPWILFTIFVFGPCEALIPILMYPAAKNSSAGLLLVTAVFGFTTVITMLVVVMLGAFGVSFLPLGKLERYSHALAGFIIFASGAAIKFLGL